MSLSLVQWSEGYFIISQDEVLYVISHHFFLYVSHIYKYCAYKAKINVGLCSICPLFVMDTYSDMQNVWIQLVLYNK